MTKHILLIRKAFDVPHEFCGKARKQGALARCLEELSVDDSTRRRASRSLHIEGNREKPSLRYRTTPWLSLTLKAWFKFGVLCFYKKIVRPRTQRERKVTIADRNK